MTDGTSAAVEASGLHKSFTGGDGRELAVLQGVELRVEPGEAVAVVGSSGAGKSTLLHLLGALDRPTSGHILIGGRDLSRVDERARAGIRNETVGFVFQFHHLLREFTALENVMMPSLIAGADPRLAEEKARQLLEDVGLEGRLQNRPAQLSGGEQQRVAVARALSNDPIVLLADEPSGNLDTHSSEDLHNLLFRLREERGLAMVLVTHNRELARKADRILELRNGRLRGPGRVG